jgi:hypothetical protein
MIGGTSLGDGMVLLGGDGGAVVVGAGVTVGGTVGRTQPDPVRPSA